MWCVLTTLSLAVSVDGSPQSTSLDGVWDFRLLAPPTRVANLQHEGPEPASEPVELSKGTIMVPGSWEAQGYGAETAQMRWQVLTGEPARGKSPCHVATCPLTTALRILQRPWPK